MTGKIKDSLCVDSDQWGCRDANGNWWAWDQVDQSDTLVNTGGIKAPNPTPTPTTTNVPNINEGKIVSSALLINGLGTLGAVTGIIVAIKRKSGFWGGVGWFFLLSFGGSAVGYVIASTKNYSK